MGGWRGRQRRISRVKGKSTQGMTRFTDSNDKHKIPCYVKNKNHGRKRILTRLNDRMPFAKTRVIPTRDAFSLGGEKERLGFGKKGLTLLPFALQITRMCAAKNFRLSFFILPLEIG